MEKVLSSTAATEDRPIGIQPGKIIVVDGISYERFAVRVPRLIAQLFTRQPLGPKK